MTSLKTERECVSTRKKLLKPGLTNTPKMRSDRSCRSKVNSQNSLVRPGVYSNCRAWHHPSTKFKLHIWVRSKVNKHGPISCITVVSLMCTRMHIYSPLKSPINELWGSAPWWASYPTLSDVSVHFFSKSHSPKWAVCRKHRQPGLNITPSHSQTQLTTSWSANQSRSYDHFLEPIATKIPKKWWKLESRWGGSYIFI